jgi:hypothetical protein
VKIPQIVSGAGIPAGIPAGQARAINPAGTIASGLSDVANVAVRALDARQRLQAEQEKIAAESDAAERLARFEVGLAEFDTGLRRTQQDPTAYLEQYQEGVQRLRDEILANASGPASAILTKKLTPYLAGKQIDATHHADKLFVDANEASLTRTLDQRAQLAGLAPIGNADEFVRQYREAVAAIEARRPILGNQKTEALLIKTREGFFAERARRHATLDPESFIREVEGGAFYEGMDPTRREALVEGASRRIEARQREADRLQARAERTYEHQLRQQQDEANIRARQLFDRGALTVEWLDDAAELRLLTPEKYEHFVTLLKKAAEEEPKADPALVRRLGVEVYRIGTDPRAMQRKVEQLIADGRLPYKGEAEKWLGHLEARARSDALRADAQSERAERRAEALAERAETRRRSDLNAAHSQAEQLLANDLRTRSPFEPLSQDGQIALADALRDLTRASAAMGGSQHPLDWYEANRLTYVARVSDAARNRLEAIRREIAAAGFQNAAELARARPRLSEQAYYRLVDRFRDLDILSREVGQLEALSKVKRAP